MRADNACQKNAESNHNNAHEDGVKNGATHCLKWNANFFFCFSQGWVPNAMKCTLLETSSIAKQYQRYTYPIRDVLAAFNGNKKLVTTFLRDCPGAVSDLHLLFKHEVSPLIEPCVQILNSVCVTVNNCWSVPTISKQIVPCLSNRFRG